MVSIEVLAMLTRARGAATGFTHGISGILVLKQSKGFQRKPFPALTAALLSLGGKTGFLFAGRAGERTNMEVFRKRSMALHTPFLWHSPSLDSWQP